MAIVEATIKLEYPDSFDAEDVSALVQALMARSRDQGLLDLPASENNGVTVACSAVGRVDAVWQD